MAGMAPAMRKLIKRGMSPKEEAVKQPKERSPEQLALAEERMAARAMRRKVAEFWSKQPHGFTAEDLYCVRTINLHSCSLTDDDGEALADGLALDGTHLHPSYVSLLEAALPQ